MKTRSSSLLGSSLLLLCLFHFLAIATCQWTLIGDFEPGRGSNQDRQTALDLWQGKTSSIQLFFTSWATDEMNWMWKSLAEIYSQGHIPIISWEPWQHNGQSPSNIEILVPRGQYDSYIETWGAQLKQWLAGPDGVWNTADDRRAWMRFAHEMNGDWYPWSAKTGESTPADYVRMWRYVKDKLDGMGIDKKHMLWIFSAICIDTGNFKMEQYYPGDDYVDWIGMGAMNWGTSVDWAGWNSPTFLMDNMIDRMRAVSGGKKALGITEYCVVTPGGGISGKNKWLEDFFSFIHQKNVKMAVYFNLDKDENGGLKDWMIFGGVNGDETYNYKGVNYKAYSSYRKVVSSNSWFVGSDMKKTNRWIDDEYFTGTGGECAAAFPCLTGYSCINGRCVKEGTAPPPPATPSSSKAPSNSAAPSRSSTPKPSSSREPSRSSTPEPSSSRAPSNSAAPSRSSTPDASASRAPSRSSSPAAPNPSSSRAPSSSSTPKSSSSSSPEASREPSTIPEPSSSSEPKPSSDPKPTKSSSPNNGTWVVYSDRVRPRFQSLGNKVKVWANTFDPKTPEGNLCVKVSTARAGGGVAVAQEKTPKDLSTYGTLKFLLKSKSMTVVFLTDSKGRKCSKTVRSTNNKWQWKQLSLSTLTGCDKTSIVKVFSVYTTSPGGFSIDAISFPENNSI